MTEFGKWTFDRSLNVLFNREPYRYEIDLDECTSAEAILDWIFQVANKAWADAETVRDLLTAIETLLEPQRTFCGGAKAKREPQSLALRRALAALRAINMPEALTAEDKALMRRMGIL